MLKKESFDKFPFFLEMSNMENLLPPSTTSHQTQHLLGVLCVTTYLVSGYCAIIVNKQIDTEKSKKRQKIKMLKNFLLLNRLTPRSFTALLRLF